MNLIEAVSLFHGKGRRVRLREAGSLVPGPTSKSYSYSGRKVRTVAIGDSFALLCSLGFYEL